ncbi:three-helix bundle dimerization domain-containing protein [Streptomyces antibioticus]|uniref:three-helix bundle dimerization domain-containing protein n=2 Tax=Streptomyces antibioticus TaxID=1890 RepID=UPI0033E35D48
MWVAELRRAPGRSVRSMPPTTSQGQGELGQGEQGLGESDAVRDVVGRLLLAYDFLDTATVEAAVRDAYEVFRDARIRAFVPILTERRARAALDAYRAGAGDQPLAPRLRSSARAIASASVSASAMANPNASAR